MFWEDVWDAFCHILCTMLVLISLAGIITGIIFLFLGLFTLWWVFAVSVVLFALFAAILFALP